MRFVWLFVGCIIVLVYMNCSSNSSILPLNVIRKSLQVDSLNREYLLYVPEKYRETEGLPLLLVLHGRLETGDTVMRGTAFNQIADQKGFAVAYPYGIKKSWADGRGAVPADKKGVDDVRFISTLIDSLIAQYNIDSGKVFVCGYSNGAIMANRLSVEITEQLAGMASVEGDASWADLKHFPLPKHLPVMFINGTADRLVKYEGGTGGLLGNYSFPSVEQVIAVWKKFNGCSDTAEIHKYFEKNDGTVSIDFRYECSDAPVEQILNINAGHIWPGYKVKYPEKLLGKATSQINASEEIWRFFEGVMARGESRE